MFELKSITSAAVPRAVAKAERYRLLNEPQEAESICRDILSIDPDNQEVLVMLLLSITDQFGRTETGVGQAQQVLEKIRGEYERAYYAGIVCERWIKAEVKSGAHPGNVSGWLMEAMNWYEKARALSAPGNDDAILRWNACVRYLESSRQLAPAGEEAEAGFTDAAPTR